VLHYSIKHLASLGAGKNDKGFTT